MGLPIVVGGRSSSSRPLDPPASASASSPPDARGIIGRRLCARCCRVAAASSGDASLSATLTVSRAADGDAATEGIERIVSHDEEVGDEDSTVVLLRLQITDTSTSSPSSSLPRSSNSKFLLPLVTAKGAGGAAAGPFSASVPRQSGGNGDIRGHNANANVNGEVEDHLHSMNADSSDRLTFPVAIAFSSDDRYLACLVPHCSSYSPPADIRGVEVDGGVDGSGPPPPPNRCGAASTVVIFSLERFDDEERRRLPLPSFIDWGPDDHPSSTGTMAAATTRPVRATRPRIVRGLPASFSHPLRIGRSPSTGGGAMNGASSRRDENDDDAATTTMGRRTCVTALCDATPAVLLAGCGDGSIVAIGWRRARLAGVLYHHRDGSGGRGGGGSGEESGGGDDRPRRGIVSLSHAAPVGGGGGGRLAATMGDGSVVVYNTLFATRSSRQSLERSISASSDRTAAYDDANTKPPEVPPMVENGSGRQDSDQSLLDGYDAFRQGSERSLGGGSERSLNGVRAGGKKYGALVMRIEPVAEIGGGEMGEDSPKYGDAIWVDSNVLATAVEVKSGHSSNDEVLLCRAWVVGKDGLVKLASDLALRAHRIEDEADAFFGEGDESDSVERNGHFFANDEFLCPPSLHFDPSTRCLAVGNTICSFAHKKRSARRAFVCIWDWQSSVLGVMICASSGRTTQYSRLLFGGNGHSLLHIHATFTSLSRETYELSTLDPSETRYNCASETSPLVLSACSVGFPVLSPSTISLQATASLDSTIDWRETKIPSSYTASYGGAKHATIGRKFGRSIAVACDRGLCVLDLCRMNHIKRSRQQSTMSTRFQTSERQRPLPSVGTTADIRGINVIVRSGVRNVHPKWRMFVCPAEERAMRVHAMTWWERSGAEEVSEDLLLAVVEMSNADSNGNETNGNGAKRFHLLCWSRRRLSMKDQLIEDTNPTYIDEYFSRQGAILPSGFVPHSMTILQSPNGPDTGENGAERAIVLISTTGDDAKYAIFQLQTTTSDDEENGDYQASFGCCRVLAKLCSTGLIQFADLSCTGVFLAGGNFSFDLTNGSLSPYRTCRSIAPPLGFIRISSFPPVLFAWMFLVADTFSLPARPFCDRLTASNLYGREEDVYVATLGIMFSCGLEALEVTVTGPSYSGPVLPDVVDAGNGKNVAELGVAKYWLTNVSASSCSLHSATGPRGLFVWTLALTNGSVMSWLVACEGGFLSQNKVNVLLVMPKPSICFPRLVTPASQLLRRRRLTYSALRYVLPPQIAFVDASVASSEYLQPVLPRNYQSDIYAENVRKDCRLGQVSRPIKMSEVCMGASSGTQNEVPLGPLPSSLLGSVLYAGQRSRTIRQQAAFHGPTIKSEKIRAFSVGNCVVAPPSLTISLLSSYSGAADVAFRDPDSSNGCTESFLSANMLHAVVSSAADVLRQRPFDDTVSIALRVLTVYAVDVAYAATSALGRRDPVDSAAALKKEAWAKSLLRSIVSTASQTMAPLQFSAFFLGIARQLEAHHVNILFPLRFFRGMDGVMLDSQSDAYSHDGCYVKTVEDVFHDSLRHGSTVVAASALPLFASTRVAHQMCVDLLQRCIFVVGEDQSCGLIELRHAEESALVRDLFQYGLKLEDALALFDLNAQTRHDGSSETEALNEYPIDNMDDIDEVETTEDEDGDGGDDTDQSFSESDSFMEGERQDPFASTATEKAVFSDLTSRLVSIILPRGKNGKGNAEIDRAISEAAHSFILSSLSTDNCNPSEYDEPLIDEEGRPPSPACTSDTSNVSLSGGSSVATAKGVKLVVAEYMISTLLSDSSLRGSQWKRAAAVARLLSGPSSGEQITFPSVSSDSLVQHALANDDAFEAALCVDRESRQSVDHNRCAEALISQIVQCSHQISAQSCIDILHVAWTLSAETETNKEELHRYITDIAVIGLITGYVSGRPDVPFVPEGHTASKICFDIALKEAPSIV